MGSICDETRILDWICYVIFEFNTFLLLIKCFELCENYDKVFCNIVLMRFEWLKQMHRIKFYSNETVLFNRLDAILL